MRKREYEKAAADYEQAKGREPTGVAVRVNLAAAYVQAGRLDRASDEFAEAIELGPDPPAPLHFWRGLLLELQGDADGAKQAFQSYIASSGEPASAYLQRGERFAQWDHFDRAEADFSEAIRLQPAAAEFWLARGKFYSQIGKDDLALLDFQEAARLAPESPDAHEAIAWIRASSPNEEIRDGAGAIAAATRASELAPQKGCRLLGVLAAAYAESGVFEAAVKAQQEAIEAAPAAIRPKLRARLALYEQGQAFRELVPSPTH
jgi:tetratricopeptide (TPR) repeat protein